MNVKRGEKLSFYMGEKGYNPSSLAKESKVPYTTIRSMIENDLKNSSVDNVIKLCKVLGIQVEDLLYEDNIIKIEEKRQSSYYYIPYKVSAGLPIEIESVQDIESITIPNELLGKHAGSKDIFFIRVNGESMNKVIPHNSLIAVKKCEVTDLKNGDIVVYSDHYNYSVKRFINLGDKVIFRPESTDPTFTEYIVEKDNPDLRLHGKVITYIVNLD